MPFRRRADPAGLHALVTGAASGIGRSVAQRLAHAGATVYLTDLRQDAVDAAAAEIRSGGGIVALARAADLTDLAQVRDLAEQVHREVPALDAVLNVAGIAVWGTVETLTDAQWRSALEVNLMGPIRVIECFVPPMIAAGRGGHLVNVSSAAGLVGLPWHAPYSASKFGLRGVSEVLRFDLAKHRIAVTLVCPGGVDTPITDAVQISHLDKTSPAFRRAHQRFRDRAVSPDTAADAIVRGMLERRYWVFTSRDIWLLHAVQRYVPPVYAVVMRTMNRLADRVAKQAGPPPAGREKAST